MKYKTADKVFKYCAVCGAKLKNIKQHGFKRQACSKCDFVFYHNSKPTVSAFIVNKKGQILLVKRAIEPQKGMWDTPGGFLENAEDPIKGLKREMKEELGITLKKIKYLNIYIDYYYHRGYDMATLNILYKTEIASGKLKPMDDVAEYKWFSKKEIPWKTSGFPWMKQALKDYISGKIK